MKSAFLRGTRYLGYLHPASSQRGWADSEGEAQSLPSIPARRGPP
jgi:hypothetical protein